MVRPHQFTKSDIAARVEVKIDPDLVGKLIALAGAPGTAKENFRDELQLALGNFKLRVLGNQQERPTRIISTLDKGLMHTNKLLDWLRSLPPVIVLDLKPGEIEKLLGELTTNIRTQTKRYRARVVKNRPLVAAEIRRYLQSNLREIHQRYCPDKNDRQRDAWVARVLSKMKISFPNEKKDRKRFKYGYRAPP
jgi:hypothetical protein